MNMEKGGIIMNDEIPGVELEAESHKDSVSQVDIFRKFTNTCHCLQILMK